MKTDRELLELAAKAIGLGIKWEEKHNCHWIELGQGLPIDVWSPIDNDGDALRLAVKLCMSIKHWKHSIEIECDDDFMHRELADGAKTRIQLTRRAIVRAAAEIQLQKEREQ